MRYFGVGSTVTLFVSGLLLLGCGDEAATPELADEMMSVRAGNGGPGNGQPQSPQPAAGAGGSGSGGSSGSCCVERPNVFASGGAFNCIYACREGYADCDGDRQNGCETDLAEPDACERCGHAFACLMPELCGAAAPSCSDGSVSLTILQTESGSRIDLGGFAADDGELLILTVKGIDLSDGSLPLDLAGCVAFRYASESAESRRLWTSLPATGGGDPASVERFADDLVFFGQDPDGVVVSSVGIDGTQRWSQRLATTGSAVAHDVVMDDDGSAYMWVEVHSGTLTIGERAYERIASHRIGRSTCSRRTRRAAPCAG